MPKTPTTVWIGTVECAGYTWVVAQANERLAQRDLLNEWHKHAKRSTPHPDCPSADCTWEEFSEYFAPYIRELAFGQVEWA